MSISPGFAAPLPAEGGGEVVAYRLAFPQARQHYVEVEAELPSAGRSQLELFMPVWTPGSYLVREYARHVEEFQAGAAGQPLPWRKSAKNRWLIDCNGAASVHVGYRVYCRELSVRTSLVERDFALLNGASIFMGEVGRYQHPYRVQLTLPPEWRECHSGLARESSGAFVAPSFDRLVDSPILAGSPAVYRFAVHGTDHLLINEGEAGVFDGSRAARDVARIVEAAYPIWGSFGYAQQPPGTYTFFNILGKPGGGLEHGNSCVLMSNRFSQRLHKDYLHWLALVAHEYFHSWNVKRLRPAALGPFDYEAENYTSSLWVAEGLTAYYDDLLVRRAGFNSYAEYLEDLSKHISDLQGAPGRKVQALGESSYDAWIKYYRPDENSSNSGVDYYVKGPLVGWLLDTEIRRRTQGQRSLDDVMRRAYELYAGEKGYSEAQFRSVAEQVAGSSLAEFFAQNVDRPGELDYAPALAYFGLRFKALEKKSSNDVDAGWLGAEVDVVGGRLLVKTVKRGTPAFEEGLNVDDEILAIDGLRVLPDKERLEDRLKRYRPGDTPELLLARREQVLPLRIRLGKKPTESWSLEIDPQAGAEAPSRRQAWLGAERALP